MNTLTDDERSTALATLKDWQKVDGRDAIQKSFTFKKTNPRVIFKERNGKK